MVDPADREALSRRLSVDAREHLDVTVIELSAFRRYQGRDRTYELINGVLRREVDLEALNETQLELVEDTVSALDGLLRRWQTPEGLCVYRGLRRRDLEVVGRGVHPARSFLSTTLDRAVALAEFTVPPGPSGPALAYQQELILDRRARVRVGDRHEDGGTLVVKCEVLL